MSRFEVYLLGCGTIRQTGEGVRVRARKELAILTYLLLEGPQSHSRESLQALFWPNFDTASARNNLRVVLSHLQTLFPATAHNHKLLITNRNEVQLNPACDLWVDTAEFERLLEQTRRHNHSERSHCADCQQQLAAAVALYQQELLTGFALDDCPAFEEWLFLQRERHHLCALTALHDLTLFAITNGQLEQALQFVQRQLDLDPLRESAYRQQMQILALQGNLSAAQATFVRCRTMLGNELGVDVEPETLGLYQQILDRQIMPQVAHTPKSVVIMPLADREGVRPQCNLPQPLTPFIGRETEIEQLQQRLETRESRLISLVGPGGIGKTRLAIQSASINQHRFANGVYFVSLTAVQTVGAIPSAILDALSVTLQPGNRTPIQQLLHVLAQQQVLLVIDNLEHLMDGVDLLLEILQAAPAVTLLVTSREQLNCQAEDQFVLKGLAMPSQAALADIRQYAAIRLFCERAYRLNKEFKLTIENAPAVVEICQLVEGMPLAIELATTCLGDLDCAALATAIAQNQAMLATTQRDRPARHRSMQAVFDYSWQLLSPGEQRILGLVALCQGHFSPQAAQQVANASIVDLTHLRYKSLLRISEHGYYDLHPLIQGFAVAQLDERTRADAEARLVTYYLHFVAEQAQFLDGPTPHDALQSISRELDNVQQAWRWAERNGGEELLAQSIRGLGAYYVAAGRSAEGEASFLALAKQLMAQAIPSNQRTWLCLQLLDEACHCLIWQSKLPAALQAAQQLVDLAKANGNRAFECRGLGHWGIVLREQCNLYEARQKLSEGLLLARQLLQQPLVGQLLLNLAYVASELGAPGQGEAYLREALTIQRSLGNRAAEQRILLNLAVNQMVAWNYQAARDYLVEAVPLLDTTGNRPQEVMIINGLAYVEAMLGNYQGALEFYARSLRITREARMSSNESNVLQNLCTVQRKMGNLQVAEAYGQEALRVASAHDLPRELNYARLHLGYVWLATSDLAQASQAFQAVCTSPLAQSIPQLGIEARTGLAAALFQQGAVAQAAAQIAPFIPALCDHTPANADEPCEMYLACYEILRATDDERADALLATAYAQLKKNVGSITDQQLLHTFWQAPAHHKIQAYMESIRLPQREVLRPPPLRLSDFRRVQTGDAPPLAKSAQDFPPPVLV